MTFWSESSSLHHVHLREVLLEKEQHVRPGIDSGLRIAVRGSPDHPGQHEWHRQVRDGKQVTGVL